jgi:S1-C subfamily serine protease
VTVPTWLLAVIAGLLVALLGFGGGFAAGFFAGRASTDDAPDVRPFRGARPSPGPAPAPLVPRASAAYLGVLARPSGGEGAEIVEVVAGSPAAEAGLRVGDVITRLDGTEITGPVDLVRAVRSRDPGDEVEVTYRRDDETDTSGSNWPAGAVSTTSTAARRSDRPGGAR